MSRNRQRGSSALSTPFSQMKQRPKRKLKTRRSCSEARPPCPQAPHFLSCCPRVSTPLFSEQPGHASVPALTQAHPWGERLPRGSVEKQGRTWSVGAVLRAHMQRSGPLARGCGRGRRGVEQSGGAWRRAGLRLTHALPVHVEDKALSTEHCVVDTVEGSQGVHTELSPVTIVSAKQALVLV